MRGKGPSGATFVSSPQIYAEPDLLLPAPDRAAARRRDPKRVAPVKKKGPPYLPDEALDSHYPPRPGDKFSPGWHLQKDYADFVGAWKVSKGAGVRIAHLDTGYTKAQASTPRQLLPAAGLERHRRHRRSHRPQARRALGHAGARHRDARPAGGRQGRPVGGERRARPIPAIWAARPRHRWCRC
ncbi:MAG: hypothetical protein WDM81_08540 [Rhizomicrobium sp.]